MSMWWIPLITILGVFAIIIVGIVASAQTRQRRAELQAQVQSKLIDRFNSAPELIDFLKSPTGQEFVSGVRSQQTAVVTRRTLGSIRAAVFLAVLGGGFLVLWGAASEEGFMYPGIILLALGAGFFASTMVSVKLARAWGLSQEPERTETRAGDVG